MAQDLKVMIATAGRPDLLRRTLESLMECAKPQIYSETVVVENGPPSGAQEIVKSFPADVRPTYVHVERANKSNALNVALERIDDRCLVFFTDDDMRVSKDILQRYANAAQGIDGGRFYGGPMRAEHEQAPPQWLLRYLPTSARGWTPDAGELVAGIRSLPGCNWAAFVRDLRHMGWFDPEFGPGSESGAPGQELEMQNRLGAAGIVPLYIPEALVWHFVPAKRCTPSWAAQRAYRHGMFEGIQEASNRRMIKRRFLLNVKLLRRRARVTIARAFGSEQRHSQRLIECAWVQGQLQGIRRGRQRPVSRNLPPRQTATQEAVRLPLRRAS